MSNPWAGIDTPKRDFNVKLVDAKHPLRLSWGRDIEGRYLFVLEKNSAWSKDHQVPASLSGVSIAARKSANKAVLMLALKDLEDWELFYSLCSDLVQATLTAKTENDGCGLFVRRLAKWQDFLRRKRSGIMKAEEIKGLIGELLFLSEKVAPFFRWENAIAFWKGPEDAPQDFAVNDVAVEVKCQSGGSNPTVRISSLEQLHPQLPKAYLAVYTLASAGTDNTGSFTLNELVSDIRLLLESSSDVVRDRFDDLLFEAGYIYSEEYDHFRFTKVVEACFEIRPGFPRIDLHGVHAGVEKVSYNIKLDACVPFTGYPDFWDVSGAKALE